MRKFAWAIFLLGCPLIGIIFGLLSSLTPQSPIDTVEELLVGLGVFLWNYPLPIVYFMMVGNITEKRYVKKLTAFLCTLLYPASVVACFVLKMLLKDGCTLKDVFAYMFYGVAWTLLLAIMIFGNIILANLMRSTRAFKVIMTVQTIEMLVFFPALMVGINSVKLPFYYLFDIDGEAFYFFFPIFFIALMCVYSIIIGKIMSRKLKIVKMIVWYLGLAVSSFFAVGFWSSGDMDFEEVFHPIIFILGCVVATIIFSFYFVGDALKGHYQGKNDDCCEEQDNTLRKKGLFRATGVFLTAVLPCLMSVSIVALSIYEPPNPREYLPEVTFSIEEWDCDIVVREWQTDLKYYEPKKGFEMEFQKNGRTCVSWNCRLSDEDAILPFSEGLYEFKVEEKNVTVYYCSNERNRDDPKKWKSFKMPRAQIELIASYHE